MAYHFSAEQYDKAFAPKRLGNWEAPHWYPRRPRAPELRGPTVPLADLDGRLLPRARRLAPSWGLRRTTWDYPRRITRQLADELSKDPPPNRYVEWKEGKEVESEEVVENQEKSDDTVKQSESGVIECKPDEFQTELEENIEALHLKNIENLPEDQEKEMEAQRVERSKHVEDPYSGYFYARKMHMDNLLHRPLPDALGVKESNLRHVPGRDLMVKPYSELNVSTLVHGPKRPVTSGGMPIGSVDALRLRPATCAGDGGVKLLSKGVTPMDLAICWDYRTLNPRDEPKRPKHIDGSNGSKAPAVFSMVHSPKVDLRVFPDTGRSNAIFSQNIVPEDVQDNRILPSFDKDMSKNRRKNSCDTPKCSQHYYDDRNRAEAKYDSNGNGDFKENREKKKPCDGIHGCGTPESKSSKSSKRNSNKHGDDKKNNWSEGRLLHRFKENNPTHDVDVYKLRDRRKSLDEINNNERPERLNDKGHMFQSSPDISKNGYSDHKASESSDSSKSRSKHISNNRSCTACHDSKRVEEVNRSKAEYKMAFKAGKPNSTSGSEGKSGDGSSNSTKVSVKVPKMKDPYRKKSYSIPTLAPPFSRWHDTSGYPEHWRLASMYQHAYKTPDPKRRPLLPAVYQ